MAKWYFKNPSFPDSFPIFQEISQIITYNLNTYSEGW